MDTANTSPFRSQPVAALDRLDCWKLIAAYLGREVRTVQRWERKEALPVHRHVHSKGSSVYAFKHEIDAWLRNRRSAADVLLRGDQREFRVQSFTRTPPVAHRPLGLQLQPAASSHRARLPANHRSTNPDSVEPVLFFSLGGRSFSSDITATINPLSLGRWSFSSSVRSVRVGFSH
jgi:hypothetical protein